MGRIGLINSGGESKGASDTAEAVRTAVINKRAGGIGLISGRKAFQRPTADGIDLLNTAHSSGTAIGASGVMLAELVTDKLFELVSDATGEIILTATEAGAKTAYLVVILPDGRLVVSGAVTHAS